LAEILQGYIELYMGKYPILSPSSEHLKFSLKKSRNQVVTDDRDKFRESILHPLGVIRSTDGYHFLGGNDSLFNILYTFPNLPELGPQYSRYWVVSDAMKRFQQAYINYLINRCDEQWMLHYFTPEEEQFYNKETVNMPTLAYINGMDSHGNMPVFQAVAILKEWLKDENLEMHTVRNISQGFYYIKYKSTYPNLEKEIEELTTAMGSKPALLLFDQTTGAPSYIKTIYMNQGSEKDNIPHIVADIYF
jgi:hypothetical protein